MTHVIPIHRMLEPTTSVYYASEDDNGVHFTNLLAPDPFEVQLPVIAPNIRGIVYRFTRANATVFRIRPGLGESIDTAAVDKYLQLVSPKSSVSIIASSNNNWSIFSYNGTYIFAGP